MKKSIQYNINFYSKLKSLVHDLNQLVNVLLTVTESTALNEVLELSGNAPSASRVGELERPEEVVSLLEVRANSEDLVEKVFHRKNTELAEVSLDQLVGGKSNALLVDLSVSTLVQKLADGSMAGVTVGNVSLNKSEELLSSLGDTQKDTVVDLQKSQQLEGLSGLGGNLVNTLDTDNKDQLGLGSNVEGTLSLGSTLLLDDLTLSLVVLLLVSSSSVEDDLALLLRSLMFC